jgi:hypothetical protein
MCVHERPSPSLPQKHKQHVLLCWRLSGGGMTAALRQSPLRAPGCFCFGGWWAGEDGADFGGVFRDAMTRMVEDCFSSHLDLMLLTPNGVAQTGVNTDKCGC